MQLSKTKAWIVGGLAIGAVTLAFIPSLADQNTWVVRTGDSDDRAYLGVTIEEELDYGEGGARITRVVDDSPADRAGLEDGDIIVRFESKTIRGPGGLSRALEQAAPGEQVKIRYVRDGREATTTVALVSRSEMSRGYFAWAPEDSQKWEDYGEAWAEWGERFGEQWSEWGERFGEEFGERFGNAWSDEEGNVTIFGPGTQGFTFECDEDDCDGKAMSFFVNSSRPRLGVHLVETTAELREHLGGDRDEGVLVSRVVEDSTAAEAGIEVGDLILSLDGESVSSSGELRRALREVAGKSVDIVVVRDGRRVTLSAEFPEADEEGLFGPRAGLARAPLALMPAPVAPVAPAPPVPQGLAAVPLPDVRVLAPVAPPIRIREVDALRDSVRRIERDRRVAVAEARQAQREASRAMRAEQRVLAEQVRRVAAEARSAARDAARAEQSEQREQIRELRRALRSQRSSVL